MNKDANIIIRVDSDLKENVTKIAKDNGYRLTDIITASLRDVEKRDKIPLFLYPYLPIRSSKHVITIPKIKKALEEIINNQGHGLIKKAYLFGSFARNEENSESDIDIRLEADRGLTLIDLGNIRQDLVDKFNREIDLLCVSKDKLDPDFYNSIRKDEICIYER